MQQKIVQWSITLTMLQNKKDIYETDLMMLGIKTLILMAIMCCQKLMSTAIYWCHCVEHCWALLSLSMSPIHMFATDTNKSDLQICIIVERNLDLPDRWSQLNRRCQTLDLNSCHSHQNCLYATETRWSLSSILCEGDCDFLVAPRKILCVRSRWNTPKTLGFSLEVTIHASRTA